MSDKHSHSEDQSMEDLFRAAFDGNKEPIQESEADDFLSQLEESGFFKEKKRRPLYLLLLSGLLGITIVVVLYSYFSKETVSVEPMLPASTTIPAVVPDSMKDSEAVGEKQKNIAPQLIKKNTTQPLVLPPVQQEELKPVVLEEKQTLRIDSTVHHIKPVEKSKDSVRVKYVMQVDTIKTVDSLTINKRKWNRMKGKGK